MIWSIYLEEKTMVILLTFFSTLAWNDLKANRRELKPTKPLKLSYDS